MHAKVIALAKSSMTPLLFIA